MIATSPEPRETPPEHGGALARRTRVGAPLLPSELAGDVPPEGPFDVVATRLIAKRAALGASMMLLSGPERVRASRFRFDRDRSRFVLARARLRVLLAPLLDLPPESVELEPGAYGKPTLARSSGRSDIRFSLSHCDDVAVFAFSMGRDIGVDVEAVSSIPDVDGLAARVLSQRERDSYRALDPRDRPLAFLHGWTRKEALVKALGRGLSYPLDACDVGLAPGEQTAILPVEGSPGCVGSWSVRSFCPFPGYVAAIASPEFRPRASE